MNNKEKLLEKLYDVYRTLVMQNIVNFFVFKKTTYIISSDLYQAIEAIYPTCMDENEVDKDDFELISDCNTIDHLIAFTCQLDEKLEILLNGKILFENDDFMLETMMENFTYMKVSKTR